jgi:hypothetical protein
MVHEYPELFHTMMQHEVESDPMLLFARIYEIFEINSLKKAYKSEL